MITIPSEINDILHQDSAYKNIRIHFPNGERADICNDLIVKDSVSFTESLCSQNTLKFGLCESPVFECEVVGVGNIKGATIEVSIEIECASDVEGAEWKMDLQKYVYAIPYGTFIVDECKRQADMIHRKIMAYTILAKDFFGFTRMGWLRATHPNTSNSAFTQNLEALLSEALQSNILNEEETELEISSSSTITYSRGYNLALMEYTTIAVTNYFMCYHITKANSSSLYHITYDGDEDFTKQTEYSSLYTLPVTQYSWGAITISPFYYSARAGVPGGFEYIYPYMSMSNTSDNNSFFTSAGPDIRVRYRQNITETTQNTGHVIRNETTDYLDPDKIHMYTVEKSVVLNYSWERAETTVNSATKYQVANVEDINLRDLLEAFVELLGRFVGVNRYGNFFSLNIQRQFGLLPESSLYPGASVYPEPVTGGVLYPSEYQSCWYEDEYTLPFGKIEVQYKNTNNDDCVFNYYLTGYTEASDVSTYQTYSLSNNAIIKGSTWTKAQIQAFCEVIANNIDGVSYMPVDFVGRGLPQVEAGDTFEILTRSGDSITTIVLNRTLTGEQTLTDSYKSV